MNPTENLAKSKTASKLKFEVQVLYYKTASFVLVLIGPQNCWLWLKIFEVFGFWSHWRVWSTDEVYNKTQKYISLAVVSSSYSNANCLSWTLFLFSYVLPYWLSIRAQNFWLQLKILELFGFVFKIVWTQHYFATILHSSGNVFRGFSLFSWF